jgi:hypothetical protein
LLFAAVTVAKRCGGVERLVERRRRQRLALRRPVAGEISVMQDVVIEELGETDVIVIATIPVARGEQMLLHIEEAHGDRATLLVQGMERRLVVVDGQLRHRLRLRVVQAHQGESA